MNLRTVSLLLCSFAFTGCAVKKPYDYTDYRESNPRSILVLPPVNKTADTKATLSFYSNTQRPLAEAGYYVFPIALTYETFKGNGFTVPDEIHQISPARLSEIFGADAAMYITVKDYGTRYFVIGSASIVAADAILVDLKNGKKLWEGTATASSEEGKNNQGGLASLLISAIAKQIVGTVIDESYGVSKITNARLLSSGLPNGVLHGPYHPEYGKPSK